jgi:putative membrane protein
MGEREPSDGPGEPDYRFSLANERTFLAWIRTALGLMAAGIAAHFLEGENGSGRDVLSLLAIAASTLCVVNGYLRWVHVERSIRAGEPLPAPHGIPALAASLLVVAVLAAGLVVFG